MPPENIPSLRVYALKNAVFPDLAVIDPSLNTSDTQYTGFGNLLELLLRNYGRLVLPQNHLLSVTADGLVFEMVGGDGSDESLATLSVTNSKYLNLQAKGVQFATDPELLVPFALAGLLATTWYGLTKVRVMASNVPDWVWKRAVLFFTDHLNVEPRNGITGSGTYGKPMVLEPNPLYDNWDASTIFQFGTSKSINPSDAGADDLRWALQAGGGFLPDETPEEPLLWTTMEPYLQAGKVPGAAPEEPAPVEEPTEEHQHQMRVVSEIMAEEETAAEAEATAAEEQSTPEWPSEPEEAPEPPVMAAAGDRLYHMQYEECKAILQEHNFLILVGSSEDGQGKTTIVKQLAQQLVQQARMVSITRVLAGLEVHPAILHAWQHGGLVHVLVDKSYTTGDEVQFLDNLLENLSPLPINWPQRSDRHPEFQLVVEGSVHRSLADISSKNLMMKFMPYTVVVKHDSQLRQNLLPKVGRQKWSDFLWKVHEFDGCDLGLHRAAYVYHEVEEKGTDPYEVALSLVNKFNGRSERETFELLCEQFKKGFKAPPKAKAPSKAAQAKANEQASAQEQQQKLQDSVQKHEQLTTSAAAAPLVEEPPVAVESKEPIDFDF